MSGQNGFGATGVGVLQIVVGDVAKYDKPQNGNTYDQWLAKNHLEEGKEYSVSGILIGDWSSSISLKEIPGKEFNTCLFTIRHR